jgi:ATP-dependent helicase/nuclease subunit A
MRGEALASVSRLLSDPQFAPVFAAGSAAEVAIVGTLDVKGRPRIVSGVIDRMAVAPDRVLIVDFKTNRPPPKSLAEVPQAYILQLALYAELLKPIYPGKPIEAALLFTENAELMMLPAANLAAALARLTQA